MRLGIKARARCNNAFSSPDLLLTMKCALLVALCLAFFGAVSASYPGGYAYGHPAGAAYPAGAQGLVTYPNGATVPVEPYAVQAARADHLAAKAAQYAYAAPAYAYGGYAPAPYAGRYH